LASAAVLELSSELQVVRADLAVARNEFKNRVGTNEQFHELYKLLADVAQPQGTGGSLHTLGVMAIRALQDDLALARAVLDSLRETGRKGDNEVVLLGCRAAWKKWLEKKEVPNGK
jgi:hypothetical protein